MNIVCTLLRHSIFWGLLLSSLACGNADSESSGIKTEWTKTELDAINIFAISGDYYEMNMGVQGNQLTGVYRHPSHPKCWFFFEGTIGTQNPISVACYDPTQTAPPIMGSFKIVGDAVIAQLPRLPQQDCPTELTDDIGYTMVLDLQHNWSSIRVVQHPALLYPQPDDNSQPMQDPLPKGTAVAILERRKDWIKVDALSTATNLPALWLKIHQLYPLLEN